MYIKVKKGSDTYKKLKELNEKINHARELSKALAIQFGGISAATTNNHLAGGIDAIQFDYDVTPDKAKFKKVGQSWERFYSPKAANKEAWKLISDLPRVEFEELNNIVGFKGPQTVSADRGIAWVNTVGVHFGKTYLIETVVGTKFKPNADMEQIFEEEYLKLKAQKINNENK